MQKWWGAEVVKATKGGGSQEKAGRAKDKQLQTLVTGRVVACCQALRTKGLDSQGPITVILGLKVLTPET
jgi:hypothetical protein